MKSNSLFRGILNLLLALTALAVCQAGESVDWNRVKNDKYLEWIEHLQLPTASERQSKAVAKTAATNEIDELVTVLQTVLARTLNLSGQEVRASVVPLSDFRQGDDVLFLEQNPPWGNVVIQDGRMLNVLVNPSTAGVSVLDEAVLKRHVLSTAQKVLSIPDPVAAGREVTFFISQLDIGKSKTGGIYYGMDSSDDWQWTHWYSAIRWWSDGSRVMFQIDKFKILHPDVDRTRLAGPPKQHTQSRKFGRTKD